MKILTLRSIVITASILVTLSLGLQFLILSHIYSSERKQFDTEVAKCVNALYQKHLLARNNVDDNHHFLQSVSGNYLARYDTYSNPPQVVDAFIQELSDLNLICGFKFYIHKKNERAYSTSFEVTSNDEGFDTKEVSAIDISPMIKEQHIYIEFPGKTQFLFKKISPWILSCLFLIASLVAIAFILYRFYKHRFWNGVQKEFVNNFVHEFRTPLSVISIGTRVLQSNGIENDPTRFKKYTRIIKEQTDQLQFKVSQILELALSGKKTPYLDKQLVDVNTLIANALSFVEPLVREKKASIEFTPSENTGKLHGDGEYLTQAMVNLLDNSLKYANLPSIQLQTSISGNKCFISVRDNGIGMERKYFKHIFRKYYRIPTGDVHNVKGFGIGLNFVKNVVNAHNGQIEVSSTPGKGTEFRIKLPLT